MTSPNNPATSASKATLKQDQTLFIKPSEMSERASQVQRPRRSFKLVSRSGLWQEIEGFAILGSTKQVRDLSLLSYC